jgi:CRP/FNR family cyclic AMP-dependent transcriptional regulator
MAFGGQDMSGNGNGIPERRTWPKGTVIFREGDAATEAYLVQQGAVRIFKKVNGRRITLGVVKPFQIFGELALFDDGARMAAAETSEDTTVLVLSKATIRDMLDGAPAGLNSVIQSLVATMRAMGDELANAKAQVLELGGA